MPRLGDLMLVVFQQYHLVLICKQLLKDVGSFPEASNRSIKIHMESLARKTLKTT